MSAAAAGGDGNWTLRRGGSFVAGVAASPAVGVAPDGVGGGGGATPTPPAPPTSQHHLASRFSNSLSGRAPVVCSVENVGSLQRVKRVYL